MTDKNFIDAGRRDFLATVGTAAMVPVLGGMSAPALAEPVDARTPDHGHVTGKRRLGSLEVSSIGMGMQNMHRSYQTTIPYRPEMINIIRSAFEHGVTFFDCAEAYGPHENKRILSEAVEPFRDKVVITSKFGWNIDLKTGARGPGLISRPDHIKQAVEGMFKASTPCCGAVPQAR